MTCNLMQYIYIPKVCYSIFLFLALRIDVTEIICYYFVSLFHNVTLWINFYFLRYGVTLNQNCSNHNFFLEYMIFCAILWFYVLNIICIPIQGYFTLYISFILLISKITIFWAVSPGSSSDACVHLSKHEKDLNLIDYEILIYS